MHDNLISNTINLVSHATQYLASVDALLVCGSLTLPTIQLSTFHPFPTNLFRYHPTNSTSVNSTTVATDSRCLLIQTICLWQQPMDVVGTFHFILPSLEAENPSSIMPRLIQPHLIYAGFIYFVLERILKLILHAVSEVHISRTTDRAMDKAGAKSEYAPVGVSIRNGPVTDKRKMDIDETLTNGKTKRKSRVSTSKAVSYNDEGSDDDSDAVPLVCRSSILTSREWHQETASRIYPSC